MKPFSEDASEFMVLHDPDAAHARRVRLVVVTGSIALMAIGFCLTLCFILWGDWRVAAFEFFLFCVGASGSILVARRHPRTAMLIMIFSVFIVLCTMALIMDVPTPQIPRAVHLYFLPLAFGSYLILKAEAAWLRHGFPLACLCAVVLFSCTNFGFYMGLGLPDGPHLLLTWVDSICAMAVLYLLLYVTIGDVSRMESRLLAANNRFVGLVSGMFPRVIAERLLKSGETFAERHVNCSVLFADIVGFTGITNQMAPEALVNMLSDVFLRFDRCVEQHGLTKIKTIGDAYMVAAGVPEADDDHALQVIEFALRMLDVVKDFDGIDLRIGVASGELVAGVIGQSRQVYDVWGEVVNLASRMESQGVAGKIQVSASTYALAKRVFDFEKRSGVVIKGQAGQHDVYVLKGRIASEALPDLVS